MKSMKFIGVLFTLFLAVSCSTTDTTGILDFTFGEEFEIPYDVEISASNSNLSIKVISIQDNRCPVGLQCVWEGNIVLGVEIKVDNQVTVKEISSLLANGDDAAIEFEGYRFKLLGATPENTADGVQATDYVFTFLIEEI
ncbi:MAG TPA: hypothetical protein ENJ53_02300 [Phaeodactylibacter sp.]|nr:hypothetical protein [Phaeodactylibacter sp.]